jgi:hypothetical protein
MIGMVKLNHRRLRQRMKNILAVKSVLLVRYGIIMREEGDSLNRLFVTDKLQVPMPAEILFNYPSASINQLLLRASTFSKSY